AARDAADFAGLVPLQHLWLSYYSGFVIATMIARPRCWARSSVRSPVVILFGATPSRVCSWASTDSQSRHHLLGHRLGRETEIAEDDLVGGARAVVVDADNQAVATDPALPAEARRRFDRNAKARGAWKHTLPILGGLRLEELPA